MSRVRKTTVRPEPSLSEILFGPDQVDDEDLEYGLLITSLDPKDNRLPAQLKGVTDQTIIFQALHTLEYEKSVIPFTSDPNPLGEIRARGVALVVEDTKWSPNLLEASTGGDDPHYWQIIEAAQELATVVVFIFIKGHEKSKHYHGVIHPKFLDVAKGPWPRRAPYVFVLSYYDRINKAQYAAIKRCLTYEAEENPLLIRIEFKNHVAAAKEYLNRVTSDEPSSEGTKATSSGETAEKADGGWIDYAKSLLPGTERGGGKDKEKEKEADKVSDEKPTQPRGEETLADVKKQLRKENEELWRAVRAELKGLHAEVAGLKKTLKEKDDEIKALKEGLSKRTASSSSSPAAGTPPASDGNLLH